MNQPAIETKEQWLELAREIKGEINGNRLNLTEVGTEVFILWYQWRKMSEPKHLGLELEAYDINSVLDIFEEDVLSACKDLCPPVFPNWCEHISTNSRAEFCYNGHDIRSWNHCPKCGKARPA